MIETFKKLIEQNNDFIKNIKRMFIMKVIEKYDIKKVSIVYNDNTKSFEINLIKDNNIHFFKYKVKRRRTRSISKTSKKMKIKSNSTELINNEDVVGSNYNDIDTNIESGIEDNNCDSSIENKNVENNDIINISVHDGLNAIDNTNGNNITSKRSTNKSNIATYQYKYIK